MQATHPMVLAQMPVVRSDAEVSTLQRAAGPGQCQRQRVTPGREQHMFVGSRLTGCPWASARVLLSPASCKTVLRVHYRALTHKKRGSAQHLVRQRLSRLTRQAATQRVPATGLYCGLANVAVELINTQAAMRPAQPSNHPAAPPRASSSFCAAALASRFTAARSARAPPCPSLVLRMISVAVLNTPPVGCCVQHRGEVRTVQGVRNMHQHQAPRGCARTLHAAHSLLLA